MEGKKLLLKIALFFSCLIVICAQENIDNLIEKLTEKDPVVRLKTLSQLANMGSKAKAAIPEVIKNLTDLNPEIRKNANTTLNKIGHFHRGYITLQEGDVRWDFQSYSRNKISILSKKNKIIFSEDLLREKKLEHADLPFYLEVDYFENCRIASTTASQNTGIFPKINYILEEIPFDEVIENYAGFGIKIKKNSKVLGSGYLSVLKDPFVDFVYENQEYRIELSKELIELPFSVKLVKLILDFDANGSFTRCESKVKFIRSIESEKTVIVPIHEPVQYQKFFFFQSGFIKRPRISILNVIMMLTPEEKGLYTTPNSHIEDRKDQGVSGGATFK